MARVAVDRDSVIPSHRASCLRRDLLSWISLPRAGTQHVNPQRVALVVLAFRRVSRCERTRADLGTIPAQHSARTIARHASPALGEPCSRNGDARAE